MKVKERMSLAEILDKFKLVHEDVIVTKDFYLRLYVDFGSHYFIDNGKSVSIKDNFELIFVEDFEIKFTEIFIKEHKFMYLDADTNTFGVSSKYYSDKTDDEEVNKDLLLSGINVVKLERILISKREVSIERKLA